MTVTYVNRAPSHSEKRKARLSLSLRQRHWAATLTAIPIRGKARFTNRRRWSLKGPSRHTARSTPLGFLGIVVLVTLLCLLFRLVWSQPENYNSQSAPGWQAAAAYRLWRRRPKGLCVLEWRCLVRWQVAGCWRCGWEEEQVGLAFALRVPATMSAARESHPHGVKRSASPDDDVNNNGGVDEGWGLLKAGVGRDGWV